MRVFTGRSKASFWATLLALAYGIYAFVYWTGVNTSTEGDTEVIAAGIATFLVLPHVLVTWLGILFGLIGFFGRKTGFQLTAAILYAVGGVLFFLYAIFLLPSIVLGFFGYSAQKEINLGTATNPS